MNLNSLFKDLAVGELSNLALAQEMPGTIAPGEQGKILLYVNDALLRLHTIFNLRDRNVIIEQYEHITYYHFLRRYAESNLESAEPIKYIKDLLYEPFGEDVIKVLEVRNQWGMELPLNDRAHPFSVFTPQANLTLQIPHPMPGAPVVVSYQAKHPTLTLEDMEQTIYLPDVLHVPLRLHIAYQVFTAMSTQEATAKAVEFLTRFDSLCNQAQENDLVNSSVSTRNTTFDQRGFV